MKRKLILFSLILSILTNLYSQDSKFSLGIGASGYCSGAGIDLEYSINKISILLGIGTVLNTDFLSDAIAVSGGLIYYFSSHPNSFYLGVAYGRTNNLGVTREVGRTLI